MSITHNQINSFWSKPTYTNFKKSYFNKKVFTEQDADLFIKIGAYLIEQAEIYSQTHIPWNETKKYSILKNPILENIDYTVGAEYLMKGIFLKKGFAINIPKVSGLTQPVLLKRNKKKLSVVEVYTINYIVQNISKLVEFTEFDTQQKQEKDNEKKQNKGEGVKGITSISIPHPTSKQILDYIQYKRNHALHRPFIATEFVGITKQLFNFLNYMAIKTTGNSIKELAKLTNP